MRIFVFWIDRWKWRIGLSVLNHQHIRQSRYRASIIDHIAYSIRLASFDIGRARWPVYSQIGPQRVRLGFGHIHRWTFNVEIKSKIKSLRITPKNRKILRLTSNRKKRVIAHVGANTAVDIQGDNFTQHELVLILVGLFKFWFVCLE